MREEPGNSKCCVVPQSYISERQADESGESGRQLLAERDSVLEGNPVVTWSSDSQQVEMREEWTSEGDDVSHDVFSEFYC